MHEISQQVKNSSVCCRALRLTDKPADLHRIPKYPHMQESKNRILDLTSQTDGVCSLTHLSWTSFKTRTCSLT